MDELSPPKLTESTFQTLFEKSNSDEDDPKRRQSAPPRVISERARVRIDIPEDKPDKDNNQKKLVMTSDQDMKAAFGVLKKSRASNIRTYKFGSRGSVCADGDKLEHQLQVLHKRRQKVITVYINKQAKASGHTTPKSGSDDSD